MADRSSNTEHRSGGARIVIFAKAPLPGQVKTRLIPSLGAQGAADLARRMLAQTLVHAVSAAVGPVELCVTGSPEDAVWKTLDVHASVTWSEQGDGDLGARMARAARRIAAAGEAVVLIGTDCPALDARHLRNAVTALQHSDATIIATADGGYVLLGLNRFHPSLFDGIEWSTGSVARETRRRLDQLGWTVQEAAPRLHDIDEPADLRWLPRRWLDAEADKRMEQRAK